MKNGTMVRAFPWDDGQPQMTRSSMAARSLTRESLDRKLGGATRMKVFLERLSRLSDDEVSW